MRTIKVLAIIGLAVALVAVPALAQQPQQPTATITVQCKDNKPAVDKTRVDLKKDNTIAWKFDAKLSECVKGLASAKITFSGTTPLQAPTPQPSGWPAIIVNITAEQEATAGPYTLARDVTIGAGGISYTIEFFSQKDAQGNAIQGATIIVTPTLTEWGLIALAVLLAGGMGYMIYRRPALRPAAP